MRSRESLFFPNRDRRTTLIEHGRPKMVAANEGLRAMVDRPCGPAPKGPQLSKHDTNQDRH